MSDVPSIKVPVQLEEGATLPQYQTAGAAGMDVTCTHDVVLHPGERASVGTGLRVMIPEGYEIQVRPRSGLAIRHGITMVNSPGTIDSDFRGEIKILVINLGSDVVTLSKGERIAQFVLAPVVRAELVITDALDETERGTGGFGSTGK
jgi:dUTP pyrophosphatase